MLEAIHPHVESAWEWHRRHPQGFPKIDQGIQKEGNVT